MKKIIVIAIVALFVVSCRENTTFMYNPDDYTNMAMTDQKMEYQLQALWEGINTSYVFWSVDTIDWDARRSRLIDFGKLVDAGEYEAMPDTVRYRAIRDELEKLFAGLIDYHMGIGIVDPYAQDHSTTPLTYWWVSPAELEVKTREGYYKSPSVLSQYKYLRRMDSDGKLKCDSLKFAQDTVGSNAGYMACSALLNEGIAYIRMSGYCLSSSAHSAEVFDVWGTHFMDVKQLHDAGKLKGIILDNRGNTGGFIDDLNYVVGLYISEPMVAFYRRTKKGLNRYDYAPWEAVEINPLTDSPYYVGELDVPYVVLQDHNSISMGEMTTSTIAHLKNGISIGERTWGGHGNLVSERFSLTYTGPFNYIHGIQQGNIVGHVVYTSTYQSKLWDWQKSDFVIQEGRGIIPQIECKLDGDLLKNQHTDNQLLRAIDYIESK